MAMPGLREGAKGAGAPGPAVQWAPRGPSFFAKCALGVGAYAVFTLQFESVHKSNRVQKPGLDFNLGKT
ncbi:hypothetical protein NQ317_008819 [Molorchus minor]|uniref:Uncharacterized protein n=1 Tax=Molorchus minor TaxID=1323400 RepID=A0ABQ9JVF5_9CUCU|nr:hypothetical protein NQ317_008819 [Molorchus minor]